MKLVQYILAGVAVLAVLPCVIAVPHSLKGTADKEDSLKFKDKLGQLLLQRFSRGTSESIVTTSIPTEQESQSVATKDEKMCSNNSRSTCRTLKEVLLDSLNDKYISLDTFYNAFVLADVYHFGLLDEREGEEVSELTRRQGEATCRRIIHNHHKPENATSERSSVEDITCKWYYSCESDYNQLPRFTVQAKLLEPELLERSFCDPIETTVTVFQREDCLSDPCRRYKWSKKTKQMTLGYKPTV